MKIIFSRNSREAENRGPRTHSRNSSLPELRIDKSQGFRYPRRAGLTQPGTACEAFNFLQIVR
jgi:hypothetical protein